MAQPSDRRLLRDSSFEQAVVDAFRRGGWRVLRQPRTAQSYSDLLVRRGDRQYIIQIKSSPEARRDH
jgi:Holliday junction resolvase